MRPAAFAVPGDLATPTGGYVYDRRIIAELRKLGHAIDVVDLGGGFPRPSRERRAAALAALERLPKGLPVVIDGLAYGVLPELTNGFCKAHPVIALVHHPLALETGLAAAQTAAFQRSEQTALAGASRVVVTSEATAHIVAANYGVAPARIVVALPGVDCVGPAPRRDPRRAGPVELLSVGSLVPRKGHDVLLEALATIADLDWRLVIAGPRDRDPATAERLVAQIAALDLSARVTLAGAVTPDHLAKLYSTADVFVLASRFEGFGMAFTEAMSYGLPIIGTTAGAIPEAVPAAVGLLIPPEDAAALAVALRRLIGDPELRLRLGDAAHAAAGRLPSWESAARAFAAAIEEAT